MKVEKGTCARCERELSKRGMAPHLMACYGNGSHLLLSISAPRTPWWMLVAASPSASLLDLDDLLRTAWLECCDHLSAFEINGVTYMATPYGGYSTPDGGSVEEKIGEVLSQGAHFVHLYDFGTTTRLTGSVVGLIDGGESPISILVMNNKIAWPCASCDDLATTICSYCGTFSCGCTEDCPECGEPREDGSLPVVNSPRMGMCGYTG